MALKLETIRDSIDDLLRASSVEGKYNLYDLWLKLDCVCEGIRKLIIMQGEREAETVVPVSPIATVIDTGPNWCQRVQWFLAQLAKIVDAMDGWEIITSVYVNIAYDELLGFPLAPLFGQKIAKAVMDADQNDLGMISNTLNWSADLRDAIYTAPRPWTAVEQWGDRAGAAYFGQLGAEARTRVLIEMVPGILMDALFKNEIPLDPYESAAFPPTGCDDSPPSTPSGVPSGTRMYEHSYYTFLRENNDDELIIVREGYFGSFHVPWPDRELWGLMDSYTHDSSDGSATFSAIGATPDERERIFNKRIFKHNINGYEVFLDPLPGEDTMRAPVYIIDDIGGPNETLHLIPENDAMFDPDNPDSGWFCNVTTTAFVFWSTEAFKARIYSPPGKV
jgi:hypothetical protein